jgi:three-Cys-motif partner protein
MRHAFGGLWTRKKLEVLEEYLKFYVTALKNQPFDLHYADAFAGTGSHNVKIYEGQEELIPEENLKGSVITALDVNPSFDHYHFNDLNLGHIKALKEIKEQYPQKIISITEQDANSFVPEFCASLGVNDRAVLFLDPYSTQLDWDTLKYVTTSNKVDLWLLFPLSVIIRMTPKDGAKIRPEWRETINRLLGTNEWEKALYKPKKIPDIADLFGSLYPEVNLERLNVEELTTWLTNRLNQIFPFVAKPLLLENNGKPLFLFFFAVSNPQQKAWGLAQKAAGHIIKKYGEKK